MRHYIRSPEASLVNSEMFHPKAVLLLGLLALLGAETNNFQNKLQKVSKNDFGDGELALSMIVNQMALLKILNESPAICSLGEFSSTVIALESRQNEWLIKINDYQTLNSYNLGRSIVGWVSSTSHQFLYLGTASRCPVTFLSHPIILFINQK